MKLDALEHPKTLNLAAQLGVELPTAIGHLELLWAFTGKHAVSGNIGKWPDGSIARACYWMGRPELFIQALRESGFIDAHDTHRFTIHDWREHAPRWVKSKLKTLGLTFVDEATDEAESAVSTDTATDIPADSKGSEGKCSEGKGRESARARATPPSVDGLDPEAWDAWVDYRTKIRKPLKPVSMPATQRALAAFGCDQAAVVEQSIANGWQGLFAMKTANGAHKPVDPVRTWRPEPGDDETAEPNRAYR